MSTEDSCEPRRIVISERGLHSIVAELPAKHSFDPAEKVAFDLLICARGFEERVLHFPGEWLATDAARAKNILIGRYSTNETDNANRFQSLEPLLRRLCSKTFTEFDADSPVETFRAISNSLDESDAETVRVAFDISGASSTLIFSAMAALARHKRPASLRVFYVAAGKYYPDEGDRVDRMRRSDVRTPLRESGIRGVDVSELYPGYHEQPEGRQPLAIVFPGLAQERAERCLSFLGEEFVGGGSQAIRWVLPSPDSPMSDTRRLVLQSTLKCLSPPDGPESAFRVSCDPLDYANAAERLIELVDAHPGHTISLVHMATKLQSIGLSLALEARPEVALVYSRPVAFTANRYSSGTGRAWTIDLDPAKVVAQLQSAGDLELGTATAHRKEICITSAPVQE